MRQNERLSYEGICSKGAEIVASDANPYIIGKDIGEIIGCENLGVKVMDNKEADRVMAELKPDVCVVATRSTMADIKDAFTICAKNGVNAISTCEEAIFPWNSSPQITKELDELAKKNNCTLAGSGYPDMYWGVLIDTLAGSMHKITRIEGSSSYNVEDYGIALAEGHGAGLSIEEFNEKIGKYNDLSSDEIKAKIESGEIEPSYMWNQNGWLCERLGLTPISQTQKCIPMTHTEDLESSTLGMTIRQDTQRNVRRRHHRNSGGHHPCNPVHRQGLRGEFDKNEWTFTANPTPPL